MTQKEIVHRLLERLIRERHPEMVRYASSLTRDSVAAEDLAQEAYSRALTHWRLYDRQRCFASWCATILRNAHIDRMRSSHARVLSLDEAVRYGDGVITRGELVPCRETPILEQLVRQEEDMAAQLAYVSLRPRFRAVVGLVAQEGLKYRQVAVRLSIPTGTVRSRMHRARKAALSLYEEARC